MSNHPQLGRIATVEELSALTQAERRQHFLDGLITDPAQIPPEFMERFQNRMDEAAAERQARDAR